MFGVNNKSTRFLFAINYILLCLFAGITLTSNAPSQTWDPFHNDDDEDIGVSNKLLVKMLLLGHEAPEGEYNVVEVC